MSKARLVITTVVLEGRTQAEVAADYGVSKGWVSKLVARYRVEGDAAFDSRSRRPHTSPNSVTESTVELIVALRRELSHVGLDAGPDTIAWHLTQRHQIAVSRATISRHLTKAGLVTRSRRNAPSRPTFASKPPCAMRPGNRTSPTTPCWRRTPRSAKTPRS